jgi:uncharacterized protein (DUF2267 family)
MDLDTYYQYICDASKLRTPAHAHRWSDGILRTLGTALNRKTKKALAKQLPDELAQSLTDVFWLLHFRDPDLSRDDFFQRAARRSGNSNAEFAARPTIAVFTGLRYFISPEIDQEVSEDLSPELREYWKQAGALYEPSVGAS